MKALMNKYFNTLKKKLIFGISLIVFVTTLFVAFILLSQYRRISLEESEKQLIRQAEQIANIGKFNNPPHDKFFGAMRGVAEADIWIIDEQGSIVMKSQKYSLTDEILSKNKKVVTNKKTTISYDYINQYNIKILTVTTPVIENGSVIGAVLLHKDVNTIYNTYTSLILLVIISLIISAIISIALGIIFSNKITKPIDKITKTALELKNRNYKVKTNINSSDEIGKLATTIDQMSDDINNNIEEIKKLESRAKELVANVSHEFKTPLTIIRGYVSNLDEGITKPNHEIYDKIINNTITLEKLVNDLLDLSALQAGKIVLNKEEVEIKQLVNDVISSTKYLADNKNIKVKVAINNNDIKVLDYNKVKQLLTIFVDNAIKFSNNKDIELIYKDSCFEIIDKGKGIEENKLSIIFDRYYQVEKNKSGYGLGLCIAKYIADLHNIDIEIKSKKEKGTKITLKL